MQSSTQNNSEIAATPFMNVRTDYAFKRVFGDIRNKKILLSMLNAFLTDYIGVIEDIELLNTEQLGITKEHKRMSYDLYGKEWNKRRFIVEMQRGRLRFYIRRAVAYMSRAVDNSLTKGDLEYEFPEILSLNFMDYEDASIIKPDRYIQRVMLRNDENEIFFEEMMYIFVNLCIFADGKGKENLSEPKEKWGFYMKNMERLTEADVRDETGVFKEFIDLCRMSNLNKKEMKEYKKSVLDYHDVKSAIQCASEDSYAEGLAEGIETGMTEGRQAGLAEGKRTIILQMLNNGVSVPMISKLTGLSETEVLAASKGGDS